MITTRLAALVAAAALSVGTLASAGPALASSAPRAPSCDSQISYWSRHEGYWRLRALDLYTARPLDLYVKAPPTPAQTSRLLGLSRASRQIPPACVVNNGYYWAIGRQVYAAYSDTRQHQAHAAEGDVQAADLAETALAGQIRNLYHFRGRFPVPPDAAR